MKKEKVIARKRKRKAMHVRHGLRKSLGRPRLSVFRSRAQIYCQIIDDVQGKTICAASSMDKELKGSLDSLTKTEAAVKVGALIAKRALEKGVRKVRFDRNWHKYHGRVKALADAAREGGLEF